MKKARLFANEQNIYICGIFFLAHVHDLKTAHGNSYFYIEEGNWDIFLKGLRHREGYLEMT